MRQPLDKAEILAPQAADVSALDEALDRLAERDEEASLLVKLRYFAGLTSAQAAWALGLSLRTSERAWSFARDFLKKQMQISG